MRKDPTPYRLAAEVYDHEPCARSFSEDIVAHLEGGYVVNTPEVFMLFRPVAKCGDPAHIVNPWMRFPFPDCWHVYLAAGDPVAMLQYFPFELPWVSFERKNRLRFWRFRLFTERIRSSSSPWKPSALTSTPP